MRDDGATFAPVERNPGTPFAVGASPRAWGDLLADAASIAQRLSQMDAPGRAAGSVERMVACADRYNCAATLLAVWSAGDVAVLPPNGRVETIDALCSERGITTVLHDGGGRGGVDVRALLGSSVPPLASPRFAAHRPIVCLYTSGSTGRHAACPKTAGQLLGEARLLVELFGLGPGARLLASVPPHHIYGLLFGVLVPFMGGAALVRSTPHHAETIAGEARRWQANTLVSVPAHLHGLTALSAGALPPLRRIFSSGAPLPVETAAAVTALAGTPVTEVLGSSETGGIAWRTGGGDPAWLPFPGVEVERAADGLMLVRSPFTASARGADHIAVLPGGRFELIGRTDGIVKIGSSRISVAEIERLLSETPGVREAAVIAVDVAGPRKHELWAAAVAPGLTVSDLRAALLRRVEPIALPRRFRLVEALPREESGKLVKARLHALFAPRPGADDVVEVPDLVVAGDWPYFRGHFADFPVLPGVVQLNDLALREARRHWPELHALERVLALKFRSPVRPNDRLALHLERKDQHRVAFELRRDGKPVSSGVLVFGS